MGREKKNFLFMDSWMALFKTMPSQEAGDLIKAVCAFVQGEKVDLENPLVLSMFNFIKGQIEENTEAYRAKCEKQAEYGRMGSAKRWGEKEKAIEEKSYPTENHSYPISENGYPIEKDSYPISEDSHPIENDSYPISENGYPIENDSYPISENGYPINCDRVEWHKDKDKDNDKDILPPYSPPKGGKADSSLRSESRENVSVYTPPKTDRTDYQAVLDAFHESCSSLPKVLKLSDSRKKAIKARLNDFGLEEIKRAFVLTEQSDFLKGTNTNGWQASFDWLMKPANLTKVLEGNYENRASPGKKSMWGEDDYLNKLANGEVSLSDDLLVGEVIEEVEV